MEATLEGQDINVRIRTSKVTGGELQCWPDSLADDYIYRPLPKEFVDICFYNMTSQYKKIYKSYKPKSIQMMNSVKVIQDISSVIYPNWNIQLYQG